MIREKLMNFEKDKIGQFDAICFLSTTQNPFSPFKEEWKRMSDDEKRLRKNTRLLGICFWREGLEVAHYPLDTDASRLKCQTIYTQAPHPKRKFICSQIPSSVFLLSVAHKSIHNELTPARREHQPV